MKAILVVEMPENCLEYPCDDVCGESCQVMDGILEGKGNMERLTERTGEGQAIPRMDLKNNGHQRCMERLAEYEGLEELNRLLKLPCAVGDEFYCIWRNKGQNPIQKMQVKKIEIHERKGIVIQMEFVGNRGCLFRFYEDDFGKTVFLTREDAEAALKELERGKGE